MGMLDPIFLDKLWLVCLWLMFPQCSLPLELLEVLLALESDVPLLSHLESMVLMSPLNEPFLNSSGIFLMESTVLDWTRVLVGASLFYEVESSMHTCVSKHF